MTDEKPKFVAAPTTTENMTWRIVGPIDGPTGPSYSVVGPAERGLPPMVVHGFDSTISAGLFISRTFVGLAVDGAKAKAEIALAAAASGKLSA